MIARLFAIGIQKGVTCLKKIFSFFFKSQTNDADRIFLTRITMSALAMVLCCGLFCASTLCYFNATSSVSVRKIQTGTYTMNLSGEEGETRVSIVTPYMDLLSAGTHSFTLTSNSTYSLGYCVIMLQTAEGSESFRTDLLSPGDTYTVEIKVSEETLVKFDAYWLDTQFNGYEPIKDHCIDRTQTATIPASGDDTDVDTGAETDTGTDTEPGTEKEASSNS